MNSSCAINALNFLLEHGELDELFFFSAEFTGSLLDSLPSECHDELASHNGEQISGLALGTERESEG